MKIHTVRKYLAQLTKEPVKNLSAHYKILTDAVCKNLGVRPVNAVTLAVVGQDSEYTASAVSAALRHAGCSSATINFDIAVSPETAIAVNGEQLPSEVISRIITAIRTVERSLCAKSSEEFSQPCVYEVFLLGALCACSEMGVSHIIIQVPLNRIPAPVASIVPQPKMIHSNEIFPEEAEIIKLIARRGVEEIVSAPQQKESRRALYNLCNELNCYHAVVARGEIETEIPNFRGIPFTYRNFSAIAGTQLQSTVALAATALVTIRDLSKLRIKIADEDAYVAINCRKMPGRGEIVSIKPFTLCCTVEHADIQAIDLMLSDLKNIVDERGRRINMIIESAAASESKIVERINTEEALAQKLDRVVVIGDAIENAESVAAFSAALNAFPYLSDVKHTDDVVLIVCGSREFIEKNYHELEAVVRDDFTY